MDEFLEKEAPTQPEPIIYEDPLKSADNEVETENEVFSYDDIYEESNYNEVSEVYTSKPEGKNKLKPKQKILSGKRKNPRFNLRKAVIYSEILNRRYT